MFYHIGILITYIFRPRKAEMYADCLNRTCMQYPKSQTPMSSLLRCPEIRRKRATLPYDSTATEKTCVYREKTQRDPKKISAAERNTSKSPRHENLDFIIESLPFPAQRIWVATLMCSMSLFLHHYILSFSNCLPHAGYTWSNRERHSCIQ